METTDIPQSDQARRGLSPAWIAAGVIALLVLGLLGYALIDQPTELPQAGSPVPDFELTAFDGSPMNLSSQLGNVVVVNYFASWCAPCKEEAADLERTWRKYQDEGVQFYGIAYKDAASKAQDFLNEFDVTYPSAIDRGNRTARSFGVTGVPETFVVDAQGNLVRHFIGAITEAELSQALDGALEP
jgi:cytochrome c biogenesis protein CcmG/thiol:disulfide interchange protein DsbE